MLPFLLVSTLQPRSSTHIGSCKQIHTARQAAAAAAAAGAATGGFRAQPPKCLHPHRFLQAEPHHTAREAAAAATGAAPHTSLTKPRNYPACSPDHLVQPRRAQRDISNAADVSFLRNQQLHKAALAKLRCCCCFCVVPFFWLLVLLPKCFVDRVGVATCTAGSIQEDNSTAERSTAVNTRIECKDRSCLGVVGMSRCSKVSLQVAHFARRMLQSGGRVLTLNTAH
jgi:hypothetical protein